MGESRNPIIGAELRRREEDARVSAGVKHNYSIKKGQILKDKAGDVTTSMSRCLIILRALFNPSACFSVSPSSLFEINLNFHDAFFLKW